MSFKGNTPNGIAASSCTHNLKMIDKCEHSSKGRGEAMGKETAATCLLNYIYMGG